jgi:hypothetical protein
MAGKPTGPTVKEEEEGILSTQLPITIHHTQISADGRDVGVVQWMAICSWVLGI